MPTPAEGRTELFRQPDGQISAWGQAPCKDAEEDGDTEGMGQDGLPFGVCVILSAYGWPAKIILWGAM